MVMLDTNICIYILKKRPPEVLARFQQADRISLSSVVYGELCYGIELSPSSLQKKRWEELRMFTSLLSIIEWDYSAAEHYASIRADLKTKGKPIGNMDLLIAAHARSANDVLVTNNLREFSRVEGLKCENWAPK